MSTSRTSITVACKIHGAATGPRNSKRGLLEMIATYIRTRALADYNGEAANVPCPDLDEWHELASGRNAVLPAISRLNIFADTAMRNLAATRSGIHQAYFAVAQYMLGTGKI